MTRKSFCSLDGPHVTACFTYGTWHINLRCNVYSDKLYKSEIKFTRRSIKMTQKHNYHGNTSLWKYLLEHVHLRNCDDVIKWKHFPRNWPFVRKIHRSPVNFPHKGQWRGALMFSLIYVWINDWANNREAGDLRRQHGHYDVIVMCVLDAGVKERQGQLINTVGCNCLSLPLIPTSGT